MNAPVRIAGRTADDAATRQMVREAVAAHAKGKDVKAVQVTVMNASTVKVSYTLVPTDRWAKNTYPVELGKLSI